MSFSEQATHVLGAVAQVGPSWLAHVKSRAVARAQKLGWPTRKTEAWKYSYPKPNQIAGVVDTPITPAAPPSPGAVSSLADIADLSTHRIVFTDGVFDSASSTQNLPEGVTAVAFAAANADQQTAIIDLLAERVELAADRFQLAAIERMQDGLWLSIADGVQLDKPIQLIYQSTGAQSVVPQLCFCTIGEGASATFIEHYVGESNTAETTLSFTQLIVGARANVTHYSLHQEHESANVVAEQQIKLQERAEFASFQVALGAELQRIEVTVFHEGEHANCSLNGVYLPKNKQHVDYHTCLEHCVPNGTSNEIFRGIVGDQANAVFNGRIHIHPHAQKTLAKLSNKNLLTSDKAQVNTKPELEIYADDVQCAHGATVAQLDKGALHYMKTRGVPEQEALVMLSFGFVNALVDSVKHKPIAAYLRPKLAGLFTEESQLRRHII